MKIQTRLIITFIAAAFVPMILIVLTFFWFRLSLKDPFSESGSLHERISMMGNDVEDILTVSDRIGSEIGNTAENDPAQLENADYLRSVCGQMSDISGTVVVRKGDSLYFTGNPGMSDEVWDRLPSYGQRDPADGAGVYIDDLGEYVKQYDFVFSDGSRGSVFVLIKANAVMSRKLMIYMYAAVFLILLVTGLLITFWNKRGIADPMTELGEGLTQVSEGNFDHAIDAKRSGGDVGRLLQNYEDMRVRLRENLIRSAEQESRNKELISNISHDLKTPITSIKGYVEGILDGVASTPEKQEKYLKTIYNKAVDMDKLINELTLYASVDNDRINYSFLKLNVTDYFRDCVEEVGLDMETRGIAFDYLNTIPSNTTVIADPEQLRKVINNIIGNSVKYMDKSAKSIEMRVMDSGDEVIVEIEDNGKGIAGSDLSRIFERFYRADAARTTSQGGSGIGLSIVKKIIEDHGGRIWATSKEGEGTCMHFALRKYKED